MSLTTVNVLKPRYAVMSLLIQRGICCVNKNIISYFFGAGGPGVFHKIDGTVTRHVKMLMQQQKKPFYAVYVNNIFYAMKCGLV